MKKILGVWFVAAMLFTSVSIAQVRNVPSQYATIQAAINNCNDGDEVVIASGTYTGTGNRDIDFLGKAITVRGATGNPNDIIIDCNGSSIEPHRGFIFQTGEGTNSVLGGLTVKNGYAGDGAGVLCEQASPYIKDCVISNCLATRWAGAIHCWASSAKIENCKLFSNSAFEGGAITTRSDFAQAYIAQITGCEIFDNTASGSGGGVNCDVGSSPVLKNCLIRNNYAGTYGGGGVSIFQSDAQIVNCTIANNVSENQGGGLLHWYPYGNSSMVLNSIIWGNTALSGNQIALSSGGEMKLDYCDVQGGMQEVFLNISTLIWGIGNINIDPHFASISDYHLKSNGGRWDEQLGTWVYDNPILNSRCVEAGMPGMSLGDEPLWIPGDEENALSANLRINMGTYGGTAHASMGHYSSRTIWSRLCDTTNDGIVDFSDFAVLAEDFGLEDAKVPFPADFDRDGQIGLSDIVEFAQDWLETATWH